MVSLKSIHPQTRQLNLTIPCYEIKLTGLWVNGLQRNNSIHEFYEIRPGCSKQHAGPGGGRAPVDAKLV